MKISLKTRIALTLMLKNKKKRTHSKSLKIGTGENKIASVAFFLPTSEKHSQYVIQHLINISKHELDFKLICYSEVSSMYSKSINHSGIIISDKQLNWWGLPEQTVASQIDILNCDAIVDLNPEFDPVHAILINKVKSSLKIGFESKWSHKLFNVTLRIDPYGFIEKQYNQINQLLGLS